MKKGVKIVGLPRYEVIQMVKKQKKYISKDCINQGEDECPAKACKIGPSTAYDYCSERLSPFGGLLGLLKFMELIRFKEIFDGFY